MLSPTLAPIPDKSLSSNGDVKIDRAKNWIPSLLDNLKLFKTNILNF